VRGDCSSVARSISLAALLRKDVLLLVVAGSYSGVLVIGFGQFEMGGNPHPVYGRYLLIKT
jgi:hypothetical protein